MPVDNDVYNRLAETWWDDANPLAVLRTTVNPARLSYLRQVFGALKIDPRDKHFLDVGCGGGFLAEELARLGCRVAGVDPSEPSIIAARAHARASGLSIEYVVAGGENLPFPDSSFDFVACCDVLEHVSDLDMVIGEIARTLKPGGVFFYDTINRTWRSKLLAIKLVQEWPYTRVIDFRLHDWNMFIKPKELLAVFNRRSLNNHALVGLRAKVRHPWSLLRVYWRVRHGKATYGELGRQIRASRSADLSTLYMGYATREASSAPHASGPRPASPSP
jgi:2-polyprenyl-6-hydroxyphenyl methylase/3-demethylubiquinone-9 3-methyltransferase